MLTIKSKKKTEFVTDHWFINPKCNHEIKYIHSAPYTCTDNLCHERLPAAEKLHADYNGQAARVKYFVEGKI